MFDHPELASFETLAGLRRLLVEPGVTDLVVNGHESICLLRGGVWFGTPSPFPSALELDELAQAIASAGSKRLDLAQPFASVVFDGRIRVHLVLRSGVSGKTLISLRVLGERAFGLAQLAQAGMFDEPSRSRLSELMRSGASVLISGASGSGKTTLLRAMLLEVVGQRAIAIEDIDELRIDSPNFVAMQSRAANVEGRGSIDMSELLVESLRMRPDRIVVGEIRSRELITLLQAAQSGHAIAATIHANSAEQVGDRIASIAALSGNSSSDFAELARKSIDAIVHIENRSGQRSITIRERR